MKRTSKTTAGSPPRSPARPGSGAARSRSRPDSGVAELLRAFHDVARRLRVRWYVFGAQAVAAYGVPRTTADVDVTVRLGTTAVATMIAGLERAGFALKIADPAFVSETRVLPLTHVDSGWDLDVVLAGPGVEELFMGRTRELLVAGVKVPLIAVEDLIATKLLAQRPKDLEDVRGLLRTAVDLDRDRLAEIVELLEEALDMSDLAPLLAQLDREVRSGKRPVGPAPVPRKRRRSGGR